MINVGVTAYNIDNLGIKAMLKTTGKQTAKAMVKSSDGKQPAAREGKEVQKQEQQAETKGMEAQKKEEEEEKK